MPNNMTNERIIELLKTLQEDLKIARRERGQIHDDLRVVKDQVSALQRDLGRGIRQGTALARKVASLDN